MELKGWRTLIFAFVLAGLGGVQTSHLTDVIPPEYVGVAMIVIGAVVATLRALTTTPVGVGKTSLTNEQQYNDPAGHSS